MEASKAAHRGSSRALAVAALVAFAAVLPFAVALFIEGGGAPLAGIAVHAVVSLLSAALGVRLGLPLPAAAGGAVLFAVHPVHVDVVLDPSELGGLAAAALAVATVLAHELALRRDSPAFVALPLAALAAALACDRSGSIAAAGALAWTAIVDRGPWSARRNRALGLSAVYAAVLVAQLVVGGTGGLARLGPRTVALGHGLATLVLPLTVAADESRGAAPLTGDLGAFRAALSVTLLVALVVAAFVVRRRRPGLAFLAVWYVAALVPVAAVLAGRIDAERWLYLPSVAFCLAAAWLVHIGAERFEPSEQRLRLGWLVPSIALVLLFVLGWRTARDASRWVADPPTVGTDARAP